MMSFAAVLEAISVKIESGTTYRMIKNDQIDGNVKADKQKGYRPQSAFAWLAQ